MAAHMQRLDSSGLDSLRRLNELFADVFGDDASYRSALPSDDYMLEFLACDDHVVVVAESEDRVVGGLVAYRLRKFEQERQELFLYDLAVEKRSQGSGVGTALMEKLFQVAEQIGAYVVFVQADEGDRAIDFYQSLKPSENLSTRNFDFRVEM